MAETIVIKGLDKLQRKLGNIKPGIVRGIKASTVHIHGMVNRYPPSGLGNKPKQYTKGQWNTWYERNWGSKWALAKGGWHGIKSSEMLSKKTTWKMEVKNKGLTGIIGSNVSYGPYVMGTEEQTTVMKRIGWKTIGQVAEEEAQRVTDFIKSEIEKELSKP